MSEPPRPSSSGSTRWYSSLRVRLPVAIALAVMVIGLGASWVALRMARQALADEVRGRAVGAAERAAHDIQQLPGPLTAAQVDAALRRLDVRAPETTLSLLHDLDGPSSVNPAGGHSSVAAAVALAREATREGRLLTDETRDVVRIAVPVTRSGEPPAAILAHVDLAAVIDLQRRASSAALIAAALGLVALVVIVDLLNRPLVHRPIAQLRDTIARVTAGDFSARAPATRADEIGEVSAGLNEMLARLEHSNETMQTQVREATTEVQQRTQQLVESYHRHFALREQLASAEQLASVGQTAANVAHQVGTPLNLISGYVQLLREELGAGSPHAPRLAIIEEQIGKVTTTVRTLLDRSRQIGRKTRTTAGPLVARVVEVMRPNLDAAGIKQQMHLPAAGTPILVDATNLELSLLNLVTNAVDAMPGGGTLTVRVIDGPDNGVRIEVSDSGHGVPEDLLPRIFEPWVSTKKPGRGTGLGLAIARDVVTGHGGSISAVSTVGQGTTFTIDLPSDASREVGRSA